MVSDYHIHLENGPYTIDWLNQFWEVAKKRGIKEIGISEHCHKFREFYPMFAYLAEGDSAYPFMQAWIAKDFKQSLDDYFWLLLQAKKEGIPVKIGLELDYLPTLAQHYQDVLNGYPFDYILGSVHVIDKWGFDYDPAVWEGKDVDWAYHKYYQVLEEAVDSSLFDIMAHLDLIKVFGHKTTLSVESMIKPILKLMAAKNICLEISSAGLRKPVQEQYPAEWIIKYAAEYKVPITFASDAHYPADVGHAWEKLVALVQEYGYSEQAGFTRRKMQIRPLPASQPV